MTEAKVKTPWHLWAVGVVTLLWNSIGAFSYTMTHMDKLEQLDMTPDQIAFFDSFPAWANALWAMGVWGAFAGSVLILLRSRWAITSLYIAIIGLIGTTIYQRTMIEIPPEFDSMPLSLAIWIITLFMLWYARRMAAAGVLR